ncbi:MAG: S49 family peptidase, partial [Simkania sp.]|nr:S49 family peptidase [Simkania sp.]
LSPYRPWKPGEDDSLKAILAYDYERFTDIVSKNRPRINKQKLINEYGAQVFDPPKAQELGYIDDGDSSYSSALSELVTQAKIDTAYQVVELKVPHPILSDLIEGQSPLFSGKIKHEIQLTPALKSEWMNRPLYLYSPALTTN